MSPKARTNLLLTATCLLGISALVYGCLLILSLLAANGTTFKDFDGAAWTQAIGSIAAIIAAIFIANRQSMVQLEFQRSQVAERVELRANLIHDALRCLHNLDTNLKWNADTQSFSVRIIDLWTTSTEFVSTVRRLIGSIEFRDLNYSSEHLYLNGIANALKSVEHEFSPEVLSYSRTQVALLHEHRQLLDTIARAYDEIPSFVRNGVRPGHPGRMLIKLRDELQASPEVRP